MSDNNVVIVHNLKKHFKSLKAVDGISFEIKKGEIFGFLGPNGAGKSTTMRCLMDFNKPTDGSVKVLGFDMSKNSTKAKKFIGYLPGNVKLYDKWTGWEHIKFFESVRGKSKIVDDLIKRLDYNPNAKFRNLSSGNKQKLGLILALMHEPRLIVMDEPTVGLDPLLQQEIYKILLELREKGATIFISSHNLPEVQKICDRAAIIKAGKIVAIESIKTLNQKRFHKIEAHFEDKFTLSEFKVQGVTKIEPIESGVIISTNGDINAVMKAVCRHKLSDLDVEHVNLEDVFMKFYERKN